MQKIIFYMFPLIFLIFIGSYLTYNSSNSAISPLYICFTNTRTINYSFTTLIKKYDNTNGTYIDRENDLILVNNSTGNIYFYQFVYIVLNNSKNHLNFMEFEEWKNYNSTLKSINIKS